MTSEYIEERNGGYYIAGTRISLDSVVCSFERGNFTRGDPEGVPPFEIAADLRRYRVLFGPSDRVSPVSGERGPQDSGFDRPAERGQS
jgi:hypothetical protein